LMEGKHLVDLGCGLGGFGPTAAAMGMKVTLIDDFGGGGSVDLDKPDVTEGIISAFRNRLGIQVEQLDIVTKPLPLKDASVDVVTCFHSLEHWHSSPKPLFREIVRVLKPGGHLILAGPNAVNLRKRLLLPFGVSNYANLEYWYHEGDPVYRGHVREPILRDLQRMLEWNGFELRATVGRNFIGQGSMTLSFIPGSVLRPVVKLANVFLQIFPSLCSDIHVMGRKP
jgi:SAM-dependent methyltransferase